MQTLTLAAILLTTLAAGCAASGTAATWRPSPQDECEQQRSGGVWLSAPGVCLKPGGGV
jgi:hypothetical protein